MTPTELLRDMRAEHAARRQYDRAVHRHFAEAYRLAQEGRGRAAERIANAAAALRMDARCELRVN